MQRSIATKTASRAFGQRLKALLGQTSFVVTLCATLALVLGAISVGATSYLVIHQPTKPTAAVSSAPAASESAQPKAPERATPATTPPPSDVVPTPSVSPPTIAQPADTYVPTKPVHRHHTLRREPIHISRDSTGLTLTVRTPRILADTPITVSIPSDDGIAISGPKILTLTP